MKIKPILLVVLALALCMSFAVSCGGGPAPAPDPEPAPAPPPPPPPPQEPEPEPLPPPPPAPEPVSLDIILDGARTYRVVSGDTLAKIARRFYGNGFYYPLIILGSTGAVQDIDKIKPGLSLTIPDLQRNLGSAGPRSRLKAYLIEVAAINAGRRRPKDAAGLRRLADSL